MAEARYPDKVILTGLAFFGHHGANAAERELGQRFLVDVELEADLRRAAQSDDLADTINYAAVYRAVRTIMEGESRNLMERLAEEIAQKLLADFPARGVRVRVTKPAPPIRGTSVGAASVEVWRGQSHSTSTAP